MPLLESSNKPFYKLACTGNFSIQTKKKLNKTVLKYCRPNTNIKLAFSAFKISSLFSVTDRVPFGLRFYVNYKFACGGCNLITLVALSDICQLGLRNIWKQTNRRFLTFCHLIEKCCFFGMFYLCLGWYSNNQPTTLVHIGHYYVLIISNN